MDDLERAATALQKYDWPNGVSDNAIISVVLRVMLDPSPEVVEVMAEASWDIEEPSLRWAEANSELQNSYKVSTLTAWRSGINKILGEG